MKKNYILVFLFLLSLNGVFAQTKEYRIQFKSGKELQKFLTYSKKSYPLVSAHRGGPTIGFPENCTPTFANTIQYNPAIIETDVALSKDSVLVMMHDDKLDRTTTGTGLIGNYTYKELQDFYLEDTQGNPTPYKIETLDEVLQ